MNDDIKHLPALPDSVMKIQRLSMAPDVDISEFVRVIENDPMLSANIIKAANSPLYGMSRNIGSVHLAVMMFGPAMIRGFAVAHAIKKAVPFDVSAYGITLEGLSELSSLQLALVNGWFSSEEKKEFATLISGVFLMELGKLVASNRITRQGKSTEFLNRIMSGEPILETEKFYLGEDSYTIASQMFGHWNFEPDLVDLIAQIHQHEGSQGSIRLKAVSLVLNINERLSDAALSKAVKFLDEAGIETGRFIESAEKVKKTIPDTKEENQ